MDTQKSIGQMEREITLLKTARPELGERVERAGHMLLAHLSLPRTGEIKARIGSEGLTYQVASCSERGISYRVNPQSWECTCPDAVHRGTVCKHTIACYILHRLIHRPAQKKAECAGCAARRPVCELTEIPEDGPEFLGTPLAYFPGDLLCGECYRGAA